MDQLTISTTFATIVGLVCNYANEARSDAPDRFSDFMESLRESHDNIRKNIDENATLTQALRSLLSQKTDVVLEKLARLDSILASVAANIEDFRSLSLATNKGSLISHEALETLNQFYDSGDGRFLRLRTLDGCGVSFMPLDTCGDSITFQYRFLEADLKQLCDLGFLRLDDDNSDGNKIFILTRQAERYIKTIRDMASSNTLS